MAFRRYSNTRLRYSDALLPLECTMNTPPYGTTYKEPSPSSLLGNAQLYKLDNLIDKPDLLKPLNCTILNPSDYDTIQAVRKVNEFISNQNQ